MAAPANKTIKDLDGKWTINKSLSTPTDPILSLQGVSWLTRKAINLATITQHLHTSTLPPNSPDNSSPNPVTQIVIEQIGGGGLKGTTERRTLDWQWRAHSDWLFGTLKGRTCYNTLSGVLSGWEVAAEDILKDKEAVEKDAQFLCQVKEGEEDAWAEETREGEVVESYVVNEGSNWTGWQVWGFSMVEVGEGGKKERRLTRRFAVRRRERGEVVYATLVYDWAGELDK